MLLQSGVHTQIQNVLTLVGAGDLTVAKSLTTLEDVRTEYRNLLSRLQDREINSNAEQIRISTGYEEVRDLLPLFSNDSLLDDMAQHQVIEAKNDPQATTKRELIVRALHELELYSTSHSRLFHTIITDVLILPSRVAKAGSTSQAIGVIWANPKPDYTVHDTIEILVHEFTHHALFIDELCHGHYDYASLIDKSSWARSAILNTMRPLDKVLHSAAVSMEILALREQTLGHPVRPRVHPPTTVLLNQLDDCVSSIRQVLSNPESEGLLKPRGHEILNNIEHQLLSLFKRRAVGGLEITSGTADMRQ
ncbi:aKG-HExxH-type peptide beta-hydroxylase [Pandoraea sp. NPDC090278]|uniref:aKG-HExxH-type peptide beta-hydroxylase n=1 Tax=Pandoraea sp. NPDC090278 TaxID=3364391 RepID=UPI00383AB030